MTVSKLDPQITGNIGLYYTCYHLSMLGWNVMPTARNARGVDMPDEVRELAHRGEKEGRVSFWLQPTSYDQHGFREAWHRIGDA